MKSFIALAAATAMLAGVSIAHADDNPATTKNQTDQNSGKVPPGTPNKVESTTGSGAMAPATAKDSPMTPADRTSGSNGGAGMQTPDTKAK
ncbi:MAG: hypothetical protein ABI830_10730 [Pseudolabrys sp.]